MQLCNSTASLTRLILSIVYVVAFVTTICNGAKENSDLKAVFMPYYSKSQMGKEVTAIKNVTKSRLLDTRKFTRRASK